MHDEEIVAGEARQQAIRDLLWSLAETTGGEVMHSREAFGRALDDVAGNLGMRLYVGERKAVLLALCKRDPNAEICRDRRRNPEPDSELRDTESIPLREDMDEYFAREVLPYVPDAWIDRSKTKVGYEIPLNRHFYVYEPPRSLDEIESDLQTLKREVDWAAY